MLNLNILFKNHFSSRLISDNSIRKFAEVHLQRLSANNSGGEFTQIITDTQHVFDSYFGSMSDEDQNYAIQQGLTISVTKVLKEFKLFISSSEGLVRAQFGKKSAEYQEFFPNKMKEYWHLNLANAEKVMERFYNVAGKHTNVFGDSITNLAQTLLTEFTEARSNQLKKKGEVAEKKSSTRERRKNLELQLIRNLHYIGYVYPGNVNRCNDYFDQSFLRSKTPSKK
ncbi:MAG: hypothetical protein IPI19_07425 [Ignavibacteriales bacterium]|nr:hypothetical protein [Ignavibacteriales bacterium]